jgi:hypothetical protein
MTLLYVEDLKGFQRSRDINDIVNATYTWNQGNT